MIQAINPTEFSKNCSAAIKELNTALSGFSSTFKNSPLSELIKNKRINKSVKEKAAWYACIVNPNIDVLLLQDYFETKQSRNILLKKETEQYNATINNFEELKSLTSNSSVYENLLVVKNEEPGNFDLFSLPVVNKPKCPENVLELFSQWQLRHGNEIELEKLFSHFCEWHALNNYSFSGHRHFILWFNYQMWKLFGDAVSLLNFEHYFFHHWNRESRSNEQSIRQLVVFLLETCQSLEMELKALYRADVHYDTFEPHQKIANNYLYSIEFGNPNQTAHPEDYSLQLNKILYKKGFIGGADINLKLQLEKVKLTVKNWYNAGLINVVFSDDNWYAYLLPEESKANRLQAYCNVKFSSAEPDWEMIKIKPAIQIQSEEKQDEPQARQATGQKAFFG